MSQVYGNVTVIPMTNAALNGDITTPFVSFEQPFEDRAGRFERQVEAGRRNSAAVILADTWPDAYHDTACWADWHERLKEYHTPSARYVREVWPETAVYPVEVARLFEIDESIRYRPQMHFFCRYYDSCHGGWLRGHDIEVSPEAAIHVDDRAIYPLSYSKLELPPVECGFSVLAIGPAPAWTASPDLDSTQVVAVSDDESMPLGQRINDAIMKARGEYIMIADANYESVGHRVERQLADKVDLSLGAVQLDDGVEMWQPFGYSRLADVPTGQLATFMFSRCLVDRLGGVHPDLSVGIGYDFFLRALRRPELSFACHSEPLVSGAAFASQHGKTYAQRVYNDIANRARYTTGIHHIGITK